MGNKYVENSNVVLIAVEAVGGSYEVPSTVLPLERGEGIWEPTFDKDESDPLSQHHGSKVTTIITAFASVDVGAKVKLPADHTQVALPFEACGVKSVEEDGYVSYVYDSTKASTASLLQVGKRKSTAAYGARANFTLTAEVGKSAELSFDFKSMLHEVTQLAVDDEDNTLPEPLVLESVFMTKDCTAYTVNGSPAHFKKVELTLGAEVKTPKDTCSGSSYTQDIKPELKVTMSVTEDNEDAFEDLKSGRAFNFVIPLFDNAGVKKWELIAPKCVVIDQKTPENEGRLDVDRTLECRKTVGDDNWELRAYTA